MGSPTNGVINLDEIKTTFKRNQSSSDKVNSDRVDAFLVI